MIPFSKKLPLLLKTLPTYKNKAYCLWTARRTGGTSLSYILRILNNLPTAQDEAFNPERIFGLLSYEYFNMNNKHAFESYRDIFFREKVCFKHSYGNLNAEFQSKLFAFLSELEYSHIHLCRENKLQQYLSYILAERSNIWSSRDTQAYLNLEAFDVDLKKLGIYIKRNEQQQAFITRILDERNSLNVSFEELFTGSLDESINAIQKIMQFLSIPESALEENYDIIKNVITQSSQNSRDYYKLINNYVAVEKLIQNLSS